MAEMVGKVKEEVMVEIVRSEWLWESKGKLTPVKHRMMLCQALIRLTERYISARARMIPDKLSIVVQEKQPELGKMNEKERLYCVVIFGTTL